MSTVNATLSEHFSDYSSNGIAADDLLSAIRLFYSSAQERSSFSTGNIGGIAALNVGHAVNVKGCVCVSSNCYRLTLSDAQNDGYQFPLDISSLNVPSYSTVTGMEVVAKYVY